MAQDIFSRDSGALLAIDQVGTLWAYPLDPLGHTGSPIVIGTGFDGTRLYDIEGGQGRSTSSADHFLGINCLGEMVEYHIAYNVKTGSETKLLSSGWLGVEIGPLGAAFETFNSVLVLNQQTGEVFRHQLHHWGKRPANLVAGKGWVGYRLFPARDVDGDGRWDLLVIKPDGGLYLYLCKSGGVCTQDSLISDGWHELDLAAGADVDGDGINDLVSRDNSGQLLFHRGLGGGQFSGPISSGQGFGPLDTGPTCSEESTRLGSMVVVPWYPPGHPFTMID